MKEMICEISHALVDQVHEQLDHLDTVDVKELGKVIHMIKNLQEVLYYNAVVEAMENGSAEEHARLLDMMNATKK